MKDEKGTRTYRYANYKNLYDAIYKRGMNMSEVGKKMGHSSGVFTTTRDKNLMAENIYYSLLGCLSVIGKPFTNDEYEQIFEEPKETEKSIVTETTEAPPICTEDLYNELHSINLYADLIYSELYTNGTEQKLNTTCEGILKELERLNKAVSDIGTEQLVQGNYLQEAKSKIVKMENSIGKIDKRITYMGKGE